jgi:hypothetical protein
MTNSSNPDHNDDGRAWGWIIDGVWCAIPKGPLVRAALGPPPFDVTLPGSGEVRHIVHNPNGDDAPAVAAPIDEDQPAPEEPIADLFPEDSLPPFHVMRHPGDTDAGWEITSMYVAEALGVPWP